MERKQYSALSILKNIFAAAVTLWLVLGVHTGWLYDLRVGTGAEQGQLPDQSVQTVHMQDQVEEFFFQNTPAYGIQRRPSSMLSDAAAGCGVCI